MIKVGQEFTFNENDGVYSIIHAIGTFKVTDIKDNLISFLSVDKNHGITLSDEYFDIFMEEYNSISVK